MLPRGLNLWDWVFYVGLILKALDGVLELVGGVLFLVLSPDQIGSVVRLLTAHEISEDPDDLIANLLIHAASSLNVSATVFMAWYLLVHGVVKVGLVAAVLRGKLWAYPWLIGFLVAFIGYQVYDMVVHFTWGMFALTVFDVFIVALTVREYRIHLRRAESTKAATAANG